jgi:acylphosphatase
MQKIVRVTISGIVQGVGYRAWTQVEAESRGISGYVRNRLNGEVEAVLVGPVEAVKSLCEAFWHGPRLARVEKVEVEEADACILNDTGVEQGFVQLGTV